MKQEEVVNENLLRYWLDKYANVTREKADLLSRQLRESPNSSEILAKAIRDKLDGMAVQEMLFIEEKRGSLENPPRVDQIKPHFDVRGKAGGVMKKFKEIFSNKRMLIGIGIGLVILVVMAVAAVLYFGERPTAATKEDIYRVPTMAETQDQSVDPQVANQQFGEATEAPPTLTNPEPLDLQSNDWFKEIQVLFLIEVIGLTFALVADAKIRKQWLDAIVPFLAFLMVVFLPGGAALGSWGVLAVALVSVLIVTFMGGIDYSPLGTFLIMVGAVGGLIFNKIEAVESAFSIVTAPILPLTQMWTLFKLQAWEIFYFPLTVYILLSLGLVLAVLEAVRPSEDKNPRWGTVIGGSVGVVVFFLLFHAANIPSWACYLVGYALAVGVSAMSQNERIMRQMTDRWSIRTIFDSAMLMTAVLLVFQLFTGMPALF